MKKIRVRLISSKFVNIGFGVFCIFVTLYITFVIVINFKKLIVGTWDIYIQEQKYIIQLSKLNVMKEQINTWTIELDIAQLTLLAHEILKNSEEDLKEKEETRKLVQEILSVRSEVIEKLVKLKEQVLLLEREVNEDIKKLRDGKIRIKKTAGYIVFLIFGNILYTIFSYSMLKCSCGL